MKLSEEDRDYLIKLILRTSKDNHFYGSLKRCIELEKYSLDVKSIEEVIKNRPFSYICNHILYNSQLWAKKEDCFSPKNKLRYSAVIIEFCENFMNRQAFKNDAYSSIKGEVNFIHLVLISLIRVDGMKWYDEMDKKMIKDIFQKYGKTYDISFID